MDQRSLLKVGLAVGLSVIGFWLLWIALLGPAALVLITPRA